MEMNALEYILKKYNVDLSGKPPYDLPIGRDDLAETFNELGFNKGAEIGVEQGLYSEILCKAIPDLTLTCIDAWRAYKGYREHVTNKKLEDFYRVTKDRLAPYKCTLMRQFSMDAVGKFEDGSLDFVFIDGNHDFKNVAMDIVEWTRKVRSGGIVSGHDFVRLKHYPNQVVDVVKAYTYSHGINPWFVCRKDKSPTWFFVKK